MAEIAVSFVLEEVFPLLIEEVTLLRGVHGDFADVKDELESMKAFFKDADRRAATEGDVSEGIRTWVKQLREAAFRTEDVIDEYLIYLAPRPHRSGCSAPLYKVARWIKTVKPRHQIAREIQDIKSLVRGIQERRTRYGFESLEQGTSSSITTHNVNWQDPRLASHFVKEADIVGFEGPRDELVGWLMGGKAERVVISVVGMGGLGKTTLAKMVFDSTEVTMNFDCHAFIAVSQTYTAEGWLRDMIKQFYKENNKPLPQDFQEMDPMSLVTELRDYLKEKRYLVFFDDVWKESFWDEIELFVPENEKGSRIIITTRNMSVAEYCKKSCLVFVHELRPLPHDKAWELFCKKAFRFEFGGHCPDRLQDLSEELVRRCEGLPLAILAIGGLLSTKQKTLAEWRKLLQGLRSELGCNPHLTSLTKILALSYDDLPYNLKSCFLYFGNYPEDFFIRRMRLIRQWIAEGFVKLEDGKTLEEVADEYLTELTNRSLIQVSEFDIYGRPKSYRVHDLLREIIIRKMKDLCYGCFVGEDDQSISDRITRRLSITTNFYHVTSDGHTGIRSIYCFGKAALPKSFVKKLATKFKLLKVMDFGNASLDYVSDNLGNLFHLRYLSLSGTGVKNLPRSIGKLQNLETLDLKQTLVSELPIEINKLTKLRHLLVYYVSNNQEIPGDGACGVQVKQGIGCLKSLQKLYCVKTNVGGLDLIMELRQLRMLRSLQLEGIRKEYGNGLCVLIEELEHLESLHIAAVAEDQVLDLQCISSPPAQLRKLFLAGRVEKLPNWVLKLDYLVKLRLYHSKLTDDPMKTLKNLPSLLVLFLYDDSYDGESLCIQGGFQKLKILHLATLKRLTSIIIDKGALPVLEEFTFWSIQQLKEVPSRINHLEKLQLIELIDMPEEFIQSIDPDGGQMYSTIKHVPMVRIYDKVGPDRYDFKLRAVHRHSSESRML